MSTTPASPEALTPPADGPHPEVLVMGGGLAGLTLALQLRQRFPGIDVLVLERRRHPVPLACHKVGESTVEIGARYFAHTLGLEEHLKTAQLKKFGFRFFFSEGERELAAVTEVGASRPLPVGSWQIDRGIFENFLAEEATRRGIRFIDGATIRELHLGEGGAAHRVSWQGRDGASHASSARWVIDACGRASLIKRQRGLALANAHPVHAVWFRIADRLDVDEWSTDTTWRERCDTPTRWMSTNHLVGAGYWVWLIPLASGSHSVGIVADPRFHPLERMNNFDNAMQWLAEFQPRLHEALEPRRGKLQDFAFFKRFSYDCKQIFSTDRWALAGEAGRFLDPFYSPGSDFIAISNTYITELIARDRAGQPLAAHTQVYEQILRSFYDSTMALYLEQYGIFGNPEVLPAKIVWDYTYYWGVLAQLFFHERLTDLATLGHLREELALAQQLNVTVQALLNEWSGHSARRNPAVMLDQAAMPWFVALNRSLIEPCDEAGFRQRLRTNVQRLQALAQELLARARGTCPAVQGAALAELLANAGAAGAAGAASAADGLPAFEPMLFPAPEALAAAAAAAA